MVFNFTFLLVYTYIIFFCCWSKERNILKWVGPQRDSYFFRIYLFCSFICVCFQLIAFVREHVWHKALLMGYSMRLELMTVCSLNCFHFGMGFYGGHSSFSLSVFTLVCFTPHLLLIFDMLSVCLCVCIGVISDYTTSYFFSVYVWMCVLRFFSLCVCVW